MDKPISKDHIDQFIQRISKEINDEERDSFKKLIFFLIKKGIIPTSRVRDYTIIKAYSDHIIQENGSRNGFCKEMEVVYDLSQRQIHNIIGRNLQKFLIDKHIKE